MPSKKKKPSALKPLPVTEEQSDAVAGGSLKLMGEMLSNVSKTRSEISQTFARNARA
jgi:hypothetical protein